ncbi:hypothetical protein PMT9312_0342 [Prochlorococcus marinus str. MIT 9312]|uniref:Uncharacterized protein n=1 Tax=Prochlorococcus marinus (strain MIT 9312) TaxID=74546 RepID=Q31CJ2_PROM9|nr:hypothetical protein PMT9312_0342 [Prochlorococcus marinus str. MIT 9312]
MAKKKLSSLYIQLTQAISHKYILAKDISTQKSHGKNLIGTKYSFEKVFIKIFLLDYFFLTVFENRFNCSIYIYIENNLLILKYIKSLKEHKKLINLNNRYLSNFIFNFNWEIYSYCASLL